MTQIVPEPATSEAPGVVVSLARYWRSSLLIVVVAAMAAYGVSSLLPETYQATAVLELVDPGTDNIFQQGGNLPQNLERYTDRQAVIVRTGTVLTKVTEVVEGTTVSELRGRIAVDSSNPGQLRLYGEAGTAAGAKFLANQLSEAYRDTVRDTVSDLLSERVGALQAAQVQTQNGIQRVTGELESAPNDPILERRLNSLLTSRADLENRLIEIQINADAFGDGVTFVDPARLPRAPVSPQPLRNAGIAALVGLLIAGAIAWVRADRHRAADESETPSLVLGAPMLGTVPELDDDLATLGDPASVAAESYQFVNASLQYVFKWGVLLVTSASRGDGKTVTAASIAAAAARDGTKVVLVDADARAAGLTQRLLRPTEQGAAGLVDMALGSAGHQEAGRLLALRDEVNLPFVPAGRRRADAASLFRTAGMAQAIQSLRASYDLVIVDCPALLAVADVASLGVQADGILVVVSRGTPISALDAVRQRLELVPAPIVGYVFTRAEDVVEPYLSASRVPEHLTAKEARHTRRQRKKVTSTNGSSNGRRSGKGMEPVAPERADEEASADPERRAR